MKKAADTNNYAVPALLAFAAGAGGSLALAPYASIPFYRYFTREGSPFRPWSNTSISADLTNGSGEPMMARNWQRILRRAGIGSNYIPEHWRHLPEYKKTIGELRSASNSRSMQGILYDATGWADMPTDIPGRVRRGLDFYLNGPGKNLSAKEMARIEKLFAEGKYDRLSPGLFRDLLKLDRQILLHPEEMGAGKSNLLFNAFRGFKNDRWSPSSYFSHANNWFDTDLTVGGKPVRNIGRYSGFQANYNVRSKWFIPGTRVYDKLMLRHPLTAKLQHGRDRSALVKRIEGLNRDADLAGKKLIFMDSGSAGPNNSQKIIDLVDSLKGRRDVHVLFQHGKTTFAPDLLGENGVLTKLMHDNPGLITPVERLNADEMGKLINGADLHITYGGSSSAGEAGSHLTPSAFTTDGPLNEGNLQFVRRMRNGFGGTHIERLDNLVTGLDRELRLRGFVRPDGRLVMPSENELNEILGSVGSEKGRRLSSRIGRRIVRRLVADPSFVEKARAHNKAIIDRLLSDSVQRNRFSWDNIDSARRYISSVHNSDRRMVDTVKSLIMDEMRKNDPRRVAGLMTDVRRTLSGSKAIRGDALKSIFSLKGARNANLALGGLITRNPIGRRIAAPLALLTALAGGGSYAYKKYKDSNRPWYQKLLG